MWGKRGGGEHNVFIAEDERERGMPTDKAGGEKDLRLLGEAGMSGPI